MGNWKLRYAEAHKQWQLKEYPASCKDFGWISPKYPDVRTSNGLTRMILYFLKWEGWRATRVSSAGRLVAKNERMPSGIVLQGKGWIPSTTRKGSADISATIRGKSAMFEVKIGRDKPSEYQLKEQELERKAGGVYEFVHDADEFFELYDKLLLS
jgi:hypothetical protein